jgi:hypothetical protein
MKYIILAMALGLVGCAPYSGNGPTPREQWYYLSSQPQPEIRMPVHCRPDFLGGFRCQ